MMRWTAAAFAVAEKNFRRIMGYRHLWMLEAALDEPNTDRQLAREKQAG